MHSQDSIVRRSVRHDVVMRGQFSIHPEHAGQLRLASSSSAREGWVDVDIVDFGAGGLGFVSTEFLPRRAMVIVRVRDPRQASSVLLEVPARVVRVMMTDRRPAYLVGVSFDRLTTFTAGQVDALLEQFDAAIQPDQQP